MTKAEGKDAGMHEPRDQERRAETQAGAPPPRRDTRTIVKVVAGLIVLILFIIFVAQNSRPVRVNLIFVTTEVRLIWVFLACALIGALIAFLLGRPGRRATKRYIKELERRLQEPG